MMFHLKKNIYTLNVDEMKLITKYASGLMTALALTACAETVDLEGKWVEPIPGLADQVQGIHLMPEGKASSINMATLQYETWEKQGDKLIVSGKSIGNAQTIPFTDTLTIVTCRRDRLELQKGSLSINYRKQE